MGIVSSICCCSKKDPLFQLKKINKITSLFSKPLADFPIVVKTASEGDADFDQNAIEIPDEESEML